MVAQTGIVPEGEFSLTTTFRVPAGASRFAAISELAGLLALKAPVRNGKAPAVAATVSRRGNGIALEARLSDEQRYLLELDGVSADAGQSSLQYLADRLASCGVVVVPKLEDVIVKG